MEASLDWLPRPRPCAAMVQGSRFKVQSATAAQRGFTQADVRRRAAMSWPITTRGETGAPFKPGYSVWGTTFKS